VARRGTVHEGAMPVFLLSERTPGGEARILKPHQKQKSFGFFSFRKRRISFS
jgi:hypothetical protein